MKGSIIAAVLSVLVLQAGKFQLSKDKYTHAVGGFRSMLTETA